MIRIVRIETAGPDTKARRLVFSDTQERVTSAAVVRELGLEPETEVDAEALAARLTEAERSHAHERALRVLGYRERSRSEVFRRLCDDGYPDSIVSPLVDRLVEVGLIDDERFASMWARTRIASGLGQNRILRELVRKGISEEVARTALLDALGDQDEVARARESLRGKVPVDRKEKDRLLRRLISRGFSMSTALQALTPTDDDA